MRIDDILNNVEKNSIGGGQGFEIFVLYLLKEFLEKQGKTIRFDSELEYSFIDAIADQGIPEIHGFPSIDGKTLIEIKYVYQDKSIKTFLSNISKVIYSDLSFDNLLIITNKNISDAHIKILKEKLQSVFPTKNLYFWGPEILNSIINKHQTKSKDISTNLFSLSLNQVVLKSPKDWRLERNNRLVELGANYQKGQMTLLLGAGVSSSAGMADWKTLLDSLFVNLISNVLDVGIHFSDTDILQISQRLNKIQDSSSLALARYLRAGFAKDMNGDEKFIEAVRKSLYGLRNENMAIESDLFASISKLCMPARTGSKVRSVITYNFDDLLEKCLSARNIRYHSIYADINLYSINELPIYHVHGFLPEDVSNYQDLDRNTFVFSEEGYHKIYSDPYHWSNLIQLNSLRENNCVLIGLSMTDPNLRRLLDLAVKNPDGPRHFVFMKRSNSNEFIYETSKDAKSGEENRIKVIDNDISAISFIESHYNLQEQIFRELGVSVIWYESYDEIPKLLSTVYDQSIVD